MVNQPNIIAISNDLNSIRTTKWPKVYDNIFFGLLSCFYKEGKILPQITVNKKDLIELVNLRLRSNRDFEQTLVEFWNTIKIIDIVDRVKKENGMNSFKSRVLFTGFDSEWSDNFTEMNLKVTLNPEARDLLMDKIGWMKLDYAEYRKINSMYARALYRMTCQWANVGRFVITAEELISWLQLPPSCRTPRNIYGRVFKVFKQECNPFFENLDVTTKKSKSKSGIAEAYIITFKPRFVGTWIDGKYVREATEDQIHTAQVRQFEFYQRFDDLTPKEKHDLVELNEWLFKHEKKFVRPTTEIEISDAHKKFDAMIERYTELLPSEKAEFEALSEWITESDNGR